jgi:hypothetical protein
VSAGESRSTSSPTREPATVWQPSPLLPTAASTPTPGYLRELTGARAATARGAGQLRPVPQVDPETDQLLLFCTASDDTLSWLRTEEALSAVWLRAVASGLALVPLSQGIEVNETRAILQESLLDDRACPHLLARVGWPMPQREPIPSTPRRPLTEVLIGGPRG